MDEARLSKIEENIAEIKASQDKILKLLIGNLENNTPGLLEENRNLRKDFNHLEGKVNLHDDKIQELIEFKGSSKKVLGFIAVSIPILIETLKFVFESLWAMFTTKHGS